MKARSKYGGYSTVDARRQLRAMAQDDRVGAILLHIDSPGGHVAGTKELADDVRAVDEAKPVHAYLEDTGASAAYWVASQARTVAANAMAMVGSLGTFTVLYDLSKAAEMEGVQVHVVSTGERKGAAAPGTPVTDEDLAEARRLVDGFDAFFRAAVREGRGMGSKEASAVWTGAAWLAVEAKGLGLVDRVEPLDTTVERLTAPLRARAAKARLGAGR
jgi:protease-4